MTPCRICNKKVDWVAHQQAAHRKTRDLKVMLERKEKLRQIRRRKQDEEDQRLLDLALRIQKQKAEARKMQQQRLLRQRQAKQAKGRAEMRQELGGGEGGGTDGGNTESVLVPNPRAAAGASATQEGSATDGGGGSAEQALAAFASATNKTLPPLADTAASAFASAAADAAAAADPAKAQQQADAKPKKQRTADEEMMAVMSGEMGDDDDDDEAAAVAASRNVYVEANPAGYAFPLLSVYAERDRAMRLERMKNPGAMSAEESLIRTLDKLTRAEMAPSGRRVRKNSVAKLRNARKKRFEKTMYLYDIDHVRPKPKYPSAVGAKLFTEMGKKKAPPKSWVQIHGRTKVKDAKKADHFLQLLHTEQVEEAARAQEIAKVQANGDHRRQLKLYTLMKAAQSQDKMVDLMEDAGMLSMPQLIQHVQKSVHLDHVIGESMKRQGI